MDTSIFKAYDVRGKVGTQLTTEVAERIGKALADWLPDDGAVAVGFDMRPDSKQLAEALAEGLRLQGREVVNIGQVASDMLYFAVGSLKLAGGAMVTASHNPGDDNGIKLCREQARPIGIESGLADIRDAAEANNFVPSAQKASETQKNIMADWVQHALGFVDASAWPAYHFAVDAGNGMAGAVMPVLQEFLPRNVAITPMYWELDGTFPNHLANPLEPKNLLDVQAKVKAEGLDFGLAFDGDGDRAVLIDETGEPVTGTVMTAILARYFLEKHPGATILYNAICGRVVPEIVAEYGGTSERTRVGHSFIKQKMREHDAVFAGEHSGHYYFRDNFSADSGLIAALVAIQVLAESGGSLSELAKEYKRYMAIPETNFEVADKEAVIEAVKQAFPEADQDELDGLTLNFTDGWINVRPSNTEAVLRLNGEAATQLRLDELVGAVRGIIEG